MRLKGGFKEINRVGLSARKNIGSTAPKADNLVLELTFDTLSENGSKIVDTSNTVPDKQMSGVNIISGKVNNAGNFDSSRSSHIIAMNNSEAANILNEDAQVNSYSLWFSVPSSNSNNESNSGRLLNRDPSDYWGILVNHSDPSFRFTISGGSNTSFVNFSYNTWNHIALIINRPAGYYKLYFNNSLVANETGLESSDNSSRPLVIAEDTEEDIANRLWFSGDIDQIRAWTAELTVDDIDTLWNSGQGI